jgi:pentose-5-phosphate-3-epimerase
MGIREIGAQGLPFNEEVLTTIGLLKERFPNKMISIDGSVNAATITRLKAAGADRFVCGSAVTLQPDPEAAYKALAALIND